MSLEFRGRRLALAIFVGLALEYVMLLFSLHSSLFFAGLCNESRPCYWLLNGLYMGAGLAFGLVVVPWSRWSLRVGAAAVILCGLGLFSVLFHA
jgi:hypothetical protein